MSDLNQTHSTTPTTPTTTNGAAGDPAVHSTDAPRKRIASASFTGSVGRIEFTETYGNAIVEVDFDKIADSIKSTVGAYGAVQIVKTAYNSSDNPVEAVKTMVKRLAVGDWRPGIPKREAEPDPLTMALADHLGKDHAFVEAVYIPAYKDKHGLDSLSAARRKLRMHPDVAAKIATIAAQHAAKAAQAARKAPREDLSL